MSGSLPREGTIARHKMLRPTCRRAQNDTGLKTRLDITVPRALKITIAALVIAALVGVVFLRIEATAQKAVRDAEKDAADARQLALRFQATAREIDPLLTEVGFRSERTRITVAARDAVQLAEQSAAGFRRSAERIQRAIDLTRYEDFRLKWSAIQESLLKRAEAAEAARDGYAPAADESIGTFAELRRKMEPFAQRAESAKAEADRLNAEVESPAAEHRGGF